MGRLFLLKGFLNPNSAAVIPTHVLSKAEGAV